MTVEQEIHCFLDVSCNTAKTCDSSNDCSEGYGCNINNCCLEGICVRFCNDPKYYFETQEVGDNETTTTTTTTITITATATVTTTTSSAAINNSRLALKSTPRLVGIIVLVFILAIILFVLCKLRDQYAPPPVNSPPTPINSPPTAVVPGTFTRSFFGVRPVNAVPSPPIQQVPINGELPYYYGEGLNNQS